MSAGGHNSGSVVKIFIRLFYEMTDEIFHIHFFQIYLQYVTKYFFFQESAMQLNTV